MVHLVFIKLPKLQKMNYTFKTEKVSSLLFVFAWLIMLMPFPASAQDNVILISGRVTDKEAKEPLAGVNILVKGTVTGTISDAKGNFSLKTKLKFPFTIVFSMVGFEPQEFEVKGTDSPLQIALETQTLLGREVVVTASRVEESILKSPVAVEKLDIRAIREAPASSFYDALENVKGVQMLTSSITFKVPNTRGFNVANNFVWCLILCGAYCRGSI
jgi:hypothetical protein